MNTNFNANNLKCDALVCGAGVSGLSTAIALQSMGLKVSIISETTPLKTSNEALVATVPTNYAMASAYPHYLNVDGLHEISDITQTVLKDLFANTNSGVKMHEIFEVFESEPPEAPLKDRRINFQYFEGSPLSLKQSINPPARPGAEYLWGWVFDSYFCDLPIYIPYLWSKFESNGGELIKASITEDILESIPNNIMLANCLGAGAIDLFDDETPAKIQRGCQLLLTGKPPVLNQRGMPKSFNYYPTKEIFPRNKEDAEYIHFFSRSDGWILGQTRESGIFDSNGKWVGEKVTAEHMDIDGVLIPKAILDLNLDIVKNWSGSSTEYENCKPRVGYRYYRDSEHLGVRIELDFCYGKRTIHNYGHGGSGVTMSWGCALKAATKLVFSGPKSGLDTAKNKSMSEHLLVLRDHLCSAKD